jgi:DNA-binding transcriptional ArsR family regulator
MDMSAARDCLSSLAQPTRLAAFRLLLAREPDGAAAGEIARALDVPQNTMSSHLAILARAGLVQGERRSRSIVYRADIERFRGLVTFLIDDCCGCRPELCMTVLGGLEPRASVFLRPSRCCRD